MRHFIFITAYVVNLFLYAIQSLMSSLNDPWMAHMHSDV